MPGVVLRAAPGWSQGTSPSVPVLPCCAEPKPPCLARPPRAPLARCPDGAAPLGLRRKLLLPDDLFKCWLPCPDHAPTCQPGSCSSSVKSQPERHFHREAASSLTPRSDGARCCPWVASFCPSLPSRLSPPPPQPHHVRVWEDDRHGARPDRPGRPDLHEDLLRSDPAAARSR